MEVFPASVALIVRALVVSARWAGRSRRCALVRVLGARETTSELEVCQNQPEASRTPRASVPGYPRR